MCITEVTSDHRYLLICLNNKNTFRIDRFRDISKCGCQLMSKFISKRQVLRDYLNVWPARLASPPGVFAAIYRFGISELLVFVNITDQPQSVKLNMTLNQDYVEVLSFHEFEYGEDEVFLSPYAGVWLQK